MQTVVPHLSVNVCPKNRFFVVPNFTPGALTFVLDLWFVIFWVLVYLIICSWIQVKLLCSDTYDVLSFACSMRIAWEIFSSITMLKCCCTWPVLISKQGRWKSVNKCYSRLAILLQMTPSCCLTSPWCNSALRRPFWKLKRARLRSCLVPSENWSKLKGKARFKCRISHVPNLTRELNACEVRRLNQLNSTVKIKCDVCRICDWNNRRFDLGSTFDSNVAFHMCRT